MRDDREVIGPIETLQLEDVCGSFLTEGALLSSLGFYKGSTNRSVRLVVLFATLPASLNPQSQSLNPEQ